MNNMTGSCSTNSIFSRYPSVSPPRFGKSSYFGNIAFRQRRSSIARSFMVAIAPLAISVLVIIGSCAQKEMVWIYTRWIVALMQTAYTFRDRSIRDLPRNAMGKTHFSSVRSIYHPVPRGIRRGSPQPAFIRAALVYLVPKSGFQRGIVRGMITHDVGSPVANVHATGPHVAVAFHNCSTRMAV